MLKKLSLLIGIMTMLLFPTIALAGVFNADTAIEEALTNSGFYEHTNVNEKTIRFVEIPTLSSITNADHTSFGCLVYGYSNDPRYLGQTLLGENYTNVEFPPEVPHAGDLEDQEWVTIPWGDENIKDNYTVYGLDFDGTPQYKLETKLGIMLYLGCFEDNPNCYNIKGELPETAAFWNNIEQYVHILAPPTKYAWGIGRMWRVNPDSATGYSYMTVPLRPTGFDEKIGNLVAVSIDLGVPAGEQAIEGEKYIATLVLKNESSNYYVEAPVAVLHGEWHATLVDELGHVLPKKVVGGLETYAVNFDRKGTPGAVRTLTCEWHPFGQEIDGLTGIVNHERLAVIYPETTYNDNIVNAEIEVEEKAGVDMVVQVEPRDTPIIIHWNSDTGRGGAVVRVGHKYPNQGTVFVNVAMDGPDGINYESIPVYPDMMYPDMMFPVGTYLLKKGPGTYRITATAMPVPESLELDPSDNTDSCVVEFIKGEGPKVSTEKGIHGELGGGGTGATEGWQGGRGW